MRYQEVIWDAKAKAKRQSRPRLTLADLNRLRQLRKLRHEEQQERLARLKRIYGSNDDAAATSSPTKITKKTSPDKPTHSNTEQDAAQKDHETDEDRRQDASQDAEGAGEASDQSAE